MKHGLQWLLSGMALGAWQAAAQQPGAIERVLPLCESGELAVRRYCVEEIVRLGDPDRHARARLRAMAAADPELHAFVTAALRQLYGEEAAVEVAVGPAWPRDPGATRVIFLPTAFARPAGEASWTIFELGQWDFDYGATDHIEAGLRTAAPVGFITMLPQIKLATRFRGGAAALQVNAGFFAPFIEDVATAYTFGGGPLLSLGSPDGFVNIGAQAQRVMVENEAATIFFPNVGGSLRATRRIRVGAEVVVPGIYIQDDPEEQLELGKTFVLIYGVRIIGESLWGDISFVAPFCDGCDELYQVLPLGIPLLGFGISW